MNLVRTDNSIKGSVVGVIDEIAKTHPDIASLTRELVMVLTMTDMDKIEVTEAHYTKDLPKEIEVKIEGDKVTLELFR